MTRLATDDELRLACEEAARARAPEFTHTAFARSLTELCLEVLEERSTVPARAGARPG
jgi:hypothetical protein